MTELPLWLDELIAVAVFGGSGYCFMRGAFRLIRTNPELEWRQVPGQIVSSSVDESGKAHSASILYRYVIDGDHFDGKRIAPIEIWASWSTTAADFVRKYPAGREVTVYVNARWRHRSVLEPQQQPIAAVCLLLLGVFLAVFAWLWWIHSHEPIV